MALKHNFDPSVAETVIGHGLHVKGNLECENDLWLDGIVEGSIKAEGNVTLGVNAQVKGNIYAANASISGQVTGNVRVREKLALTQSGHLLGDVKTVGLMVDDGAVLIGTVSMPDDTQTTPTNQDDETEATTNQDSVDS